jgi:hypothetical protein
MEECVICGSTRVKRLLYPRVYGPHSRIGWSRRRGIYGRRAVARRLRGLSAYCICRPYRGKETMELFILSFVFEDLEGRYVKIDAMIEDTASDMRVGLRRRRVETSKLSAS